MGGDLSNREDGASTNKDLWHLPTESPYTLLSGRCAQDDLNHIEATRMEGAGHGDGVSCVIQAHHWHDERLA